MSRRANILADEQFLALQKRVIAESQDAARDCVIILLTFKAALRVGEVSGLQWRDVLNTDGTVGILNEHGKRCISVPRSVAKKGHDRMIPMHPAVEAWLEILLKQNFPNGKARGNIIHGLKKGRTRISANSLQRYLSRLYQEHGLMGVTSHSGRRTALTKMARIANTYGCSLKDVQMVAGHSDISTTENYIELSDTVSDLIGAL